MLCGAWFTIGDWRQCDRPEVGRIILAAYAYREGEPPPSAIEILGRGAHATIGKYTNSGERRALLSGEGVEHGKR